MRTVGFDTNVLLTLKLKRKPGFLKAKLYLEKCLEGKINIFIPIAAFLETEWVLRSFYKLQKEKIVEYLDELMIMDNFISEEKDEVKLALTIFKQSQATSFTDSVIIAQIHNRNYDFLTFDQNLKKLYNSLNN